MKSTLAHLQLNINYKENVEFYKELMNFLGWDMLFEGDNVIGFKGTSETSVWFVNAINQEESNYDNYGMNHISFGVDSQSHIDDVAEFVGAKKIAALFETPRHRPEMAASEDETYYQIMFETPDNILVEVVYTGAKS